jgi:hypothetical protein
MADSEETVFRARLEQVGDNMFRAFYRRETIGAEDDQGAKGHITPDTHIGTDAEAVKAFVESMAKNRGYQRVLWEQ